MGGGSHLEIITQCLGSSACIIYQSHWKRIVPLWTSFHWTRGLSSSLSLFVLILSASVALLPHFHSNSAQQDKTTASLNTNHPGAGPAEPSEGLALRPAPGPHSQAVRTLEDSFKIHHPARRDAASADPAPSPSLDGDFDSVKNQLQTEASLSKSLVYC